MSVLGGFVVVTLSFNDKMDLVNFECYLMTRDSQKLPHKDGNVEEADLKQYNQSATHIDPWVGTGGGMMLTQVAFLQFLPSSQYGLCFGYCFSGLLPLRSHIEQVTFLGSFLGVPSLLDNTRNRPEPS